MAAKTKSRPPTTQWQYRSKSFRTVQRAQWIGGPGASRRAPGQSGGVADPDAVLTYLNAQGQRGFELVGMFDSNVTTRSVPTPMPKFTLILKRPRP